MVLFLLLVCFQGVDIADHCRASCVAPVDLSGIPLQNRPRPDIARELGVRVGEQIERVEYMPWSKAKLNVGYDTLRHHMQDIEAEVLKLVD